MSIAGNTNIFWQGDLTLSYTITDAAGNTSDGQITIPAEGVLPVLQGALQQFAPDLLEKTGVFAAGAKER